MTKNRSTLMKRRTVGIVVAAVVVIVLAIALALIMNYVRTTTITDPVDNSVYYIRYRDKAFAVYDADKETLMPTEEQYGYYVLRSGTLVDIDQEAGSYQFVIVDDALEGNEQHEGYRFNIMMFPHVEGKNIRQLDVYNSKGSFTFYRYNIEKGKADDSAGFIIKGSPLVNYDEELFTSLYVSAGYTITKQKLTDPIKDSNGEYSEYGLVPAVRPAYDEETGEPIIDETTGEQKTYNYTPAYYVLTDTSGNKYKVIIGDRLVSGDGYYAQYVDMSTGSEVKRDAVYVVSTDIADTMLARIEDFVTPALTYPLSLNDYFDVQNFFIYKKKAGATVDVKDAYEGIIGFSYIDLSERENTIKASQPYVFAGEIIDGYFPSDENIQACLQALYDPSFSGVCKIAPNGRDLFEYDLAVESGVDDKGNTKYELFSEYIVSYNFDVFDDDGNLVETINNLIYFSDVNENGKRYAYTEIYSVNKKGERDELAYSLGMIVEVDAHTVEFLNWDSFDWITEQYFNLNIAFCDKMTLQSSGYWAEFDFDNSKSDMSESISSEKLAISAKDSAGNDRVTFSVLTFVDIDGYTWEITSTDVNLYKDGNEYKIEEAVYGYNAMGRQALTINGFISCADGTKVYVSADEVIVEPLDSSKTVKYIRYDTNLFRQFYQTLLYANIANSYELSDEEKAALENDPSRKLLTLTVVNTEGETTEYCFYSLTSRKAYITINGYGGFYVMTNRVEKLISDAQKFFANELIDATAKN